VECYDNENLDVVVWRNKLPGFGYAIALSLTMAYDTLLVGIQNQIAALDPNTGGFVWNHKVRIPGLFGFVTFATYNGKLLACAGGTMICISVIDGSVLWEDGLKGLGYNNGCIISTEYPQLNFNSQPCHIDEGSRARK